MALHGGAIPTRPRSLIAGGTAVPTAGRPAGARPAPAAWGGRSGGAPTLPCMGATALGQARAAPHRAGPGARPASGGGPERLASQPRSGRSGPPHALSGASSRLSGAAAAQRRWCGGGGEGRARAVGQRARSQPPRPPASCAAAGRPPTYTHLVSSFGTSMDNTKVFTNIPSHHCFLALDFVHVSIDS